MIFSVEGDVPSAVTSLGYLLGAVARDRDHTIIRMFASNMTTLSVYTYAEFSDLFSVFRVSLPTNRLYKTMSSRFLAIA